MPPWMTVREMPQMMPAAVNNGSTSRGRKPLGRMGSISDHSCISPAMVAWVNTTPLGLPVVPLVKTIAVGVETSTTGVGNVACSPPRRGRTSCSRTAIEKVSCAFRTSSSLGRYA